MMIKPPQTGVKTRGVSKPVPQAGKRKKERAGRKKPPTHSLADDKARFKQIHERLRALDKTRKKAERERERAERESQDLQKEQAKLRKVLEKLAGEGSAGAGKIRIGKGGSAGVGRKLIREGSAGAGKKATNSKSAGAAGPLQVSQLRLSACGPVSSSLDHDVIHDVIHVTCPEPCDVMDDITFPDSDLTFPDLPLSFSSRAQAATGNCLFEVDDIFHHVLSYLGESHLILLSMVSKRTKRLVDSAPPELSLW